RRMACTVAWASSVAGHFNFDFNVSFPEEQQRKGGVEYNYRREVVFQWRAGQEGGGERAEGEFAAMGGTDAGTYHRDRPGMSAFALEDGVVYHTYSTYARGLDGLWACTSGSTAPPGHATRQASGGAAMTSTTRAERSRGCRAATVAMMLPPLVPMLWRRRPASIADQGTAFAD